MSIPKKEALLLLLHAPIVRVVVRPKSVGVVLPESLIDHDHVALDIGYRMAVPIVDLVIDDQGFTATLSFDRAPFHVTVPWHSVVAMAVPDEAQMVWPIEDTPPPKPAKRPTLRAV